SSERRMAGEWAGKLQVKYGRLRNAVSTLSGGNQQKVVLGKWLARNPRLLIIDEPTRGIDVGTKAEVHRILDGLVADGMAVLMISSELPEVLGMADRVLVLRETLVIVTRNVDLSVGSVLGLSAYIVGDLFKYHHIPVWSGFAIGILVGAVAGAVNGFIVTVMRVPSLVVTLGMLYVIRGIDG